MVLNLTGPLLCLVSLRAQALEVMAINHKNNASKKCVHRGLHCNTKYCQVCKPRFRSHFVVAFPARFLESEQMLHGNLKRSIAKSKWIQSAPT